MPPIKICTKEGGSNAVGARELLRCPGRAGKKERNFSRPAQSEYMGEEARKGDAAGRGNSTCEGNRRRRQWVCLGADLW